MSKPRRPNPTALVSWAHSDPAWDVGRTAAWKDEVLIFVRELRQLGIDADIDLHHSAEPVDWNRFGPQAVIDNEWVVVALSLAWKIRWEGRNAEGEGTGAYAEADALWSVFQQAGQSAFRQKLALVILPSMLGTDAVPTGLHGINRFEIHEITPAGLEPLIRLLTDQPEHPKAPLGQVPELPSRLNPDPSRRGDRSDTGASWSAEASEGGGSAAQTPPEGGTKRLIAALEDRDAMVRFEAMSALGDRLAPELLPTIEPLLTDRDDYIRRMAVEYYAQLVDDRGTKRLIAALEDRDAMVRFEAMSALGNRLAPELLPTIEPLLTDRDDYIRRMAVEYYAQLA